MTTATTRALRAAVAIAIAIGASRLQGQTAATTPPATRDGLPTATPEAAGMSTARLRRIHDVVQRQIEAGTISGAVTLVARNGRVVHFEAHGLRDVEARAPMTKDAIFRIASMTKPITGVAVLMMVEQGKIRLDDPLSRFIPEFKNMKVAPPRGATGPIPVDCDRACLERLIGQQPVDQAPVESVPASREITIRHLLTHTAGLVTVNGLVAQRPVRPWPLMPTDTLASYIPKLAGLPLDFQPGTRWAYSPLVGGDVLARVVEIASGQTYDRFLKERVFDPLGMRDTFFYLPEDRRSRLVSLYDATPSGLRLRPERVSTFNGAFFGGGANLQSTAEDYVRFAQMLANGGILNRRRLLKAETVRVMASNQVGEMVPSGMGQGFLVATVEDPIAARRRVSARSFGFGGTFGTQVWIDPKEKLVTILMIQSAPANEALRRDFEEAVLQSIVR